MRRFLLVLLVSSGCGESPAGGDPDAGQADSGTPDAGPPGQTWRFVQTSLNVPTTASEASSLSFNVDGDPQGRPDNALGQVFAVLSQSAFIDVQQFNDDAIASGQLLTLHAVEANDLVADTSATWQVYQAVPKPNPDFSGAGTFTIDAEGPQDARLTGAITAGRFEGGPGALPLRLALFSATEPVTVTLQGARLRADLTATTCANGVIGGAVKAEEVDAVIVPAMAAQLNAVVAADTGCPTSCAPDTLTLLAIFDTDGDRTITADEFRANSMMQALFAADVDLFDSTGAFNPRVDGVNDSNSIGVGFDCVRAQF